MNSERKIKVLKLYEERCNGCFECMKACSMIHFKSKEGGEKSAIKINKVKGRYIMNVCDQRGLCIDMCPVGALKRKKNGIVWLDKNKCIGCQACVGFCPINAMRKSKERIEPFKCISCGACIRACPEKALEFVEKDPEDIKQIVYHKQGV